MNKKRIVISSIAGTLAITTALSFIGFSKKKLKALPATGTMISTEFKDYIEEESIYIETSKPSQLTNETTMVTQKKEDTEQDYESFLKQINEIIDEKNFDEQTKKLIIGSYDLLYENYNNTYRAYKMSGIPTREEYIQKQFIDILKNDIDQVIIYDENSEEKKTIFKNAGAYYNPSTKVMKILNKKNFNELCAMYLHEKDHAYQRKFLTTSISSNIRIENKGLWYILTEGEADLGDTAVSKTIQHRGNNIINFPEDNGYYNAYGKTSSTKYNLAYRFYSMLSHMAGYATMQQLKENGDIATLINIINNKYNIDCTEFIDKCSNLVFHFYEEQEDEKYICETIEYIDNFYLNCLSIEVEKINNKEEAIDMFNYYRYYKLQEQTKYVGSIVDDHRDLTEEKYDFSIVENKLFNKLIEYNAFDIYIEDANLYRKAFDAILRIDSSNSMITIEPITLSGREYLMLEAEGKVVLYYDRHAVYYDLEGGNKRKEFLANNEQKNTKRFIEEVSSKSR